jgi:Tol biopolymer transport system component
MIRSTLTAVAIATAVSACSRPLGSGTPAADTVPIRAIAPDSGETRLANIRQLTYGGENAEAYFSPDGRALIFQSTRDGLWTANRDGSNRKRLTSYGIYTAEATLSPDGKTLVFTSLKDGDLELYLMNVDGSNVRRITHTPGYDGGAFFSPDGRQIVYRSWHPTGDDLKAYQDLLAQGMVRPNRMEIWVMNADGSNQRQVTRLGGANFAPFFTPDSRRIIFSSNYRNPRSRNFDLYLVNADGSGLEQVTTDAEFDGFPMFSPDGRKLVWASNRNAPNPGGTDIFIADWRP